jgi:transcriptional regulator with XRE-family HTH domain
MIGEIRNALHAALEEEHDIRGLTQSQMAVALGVDKSFVSRKMNGTSNMTLETLADLAFALNRPVKVELPSRAPEQGSNRRPPPDFSKIDVKRNTSSTSDVAEKSPRIRILEIA